MMFYHKLQDDELAFMATGAETPFTFAIHEGRYRTEEEAVARLALEAETASTYLAIQGVKGVRADGARGRVWTDRDASGEAFMLLLNQYRVRREEGVVIVEVT